MRVGNISPHPGENFMKVVNNFPDLAQYFLQVVEAYFTCKKYFAHLIVNFPHLIENFPHLKELTAHLQILFFYFQEFSVRKGKNKTAWMVHSRRLLLNKLLPNNTFISGSFYKIHAVCEVANVNVYS